MPFASLKDAPDSMKSVSQTNGAKRVKLTLVQVNNLADMFDAISAAGEVDNPMAVAISSFRKKYKVKNGRWVLRKKKKSETLDDAFIAALKLMAYDSSSEGNLTNNLKVEVTRMPTNFKGRPLFEVYASIPGSLDSHQRAIRAAIVANPPAEIGLIEHDWDISFEAVIPDEDITGATVYFYNWRNEDESGSPKYFSAKVEFADGVAEISDVVEVEFKIVISAKNEMRQLEQQLVENKPEVKQFSELFDTTCELLEAKHGKMRRAKVKVAQKANEINSNNRYYSKKVLEAAVLEAKEKLPLLMDSKHRMETELTETTSVIHDISINSVGEVELGNIEFLENGPGRLIHELMEKGVKLQVSQRGYGSSHIGEINGKSVEIVDVIYFKGFDFTAPSEASVIQADVKLAESKSGKISVIERKTEMPEINIGALLGNPAFAAEVARIAAEKSPNMADEWRKLTDSYNVTKQQVDVFLFDQSKVKFEKTVDVVVNTALAKDEYSRFSDENKRTIREGIDVDSLISLVENVEDEAQVKTVIMPVLTAEIERADQYIASVKLESTGYKPGLIQAHGVTHVTVMEEHAPGAEERVKLTEMVLDKFKRDMPGGYWYMPEDHPNFKTLVDGQIDEMGIMPMFYQTHHHKLLLEANEEVTQSDIGGRISTIAAVVIPIAWRMITAFQVYQTGTMQRVIEDHKITQWNVPNSPLVLTDDVADEWSQVEVGEGGTLPVGGVQYTSFPLHATQQSIKTFITPNAMAVARGTPMAPVIDTLAGLALDIRNRIDRMLWWLLISKAQEFGAVEVTAFETLTNLTTPSGASVAGDELSAANDLWIRYEWVKANDANGNPLTAKLVKLYPESAAATATLPTEAVLTAVAVREAGGDNTVLNYIDDYTINWADGTISITAAGAVKENSNGLEATYTYTTNGRTWDLTPDTGVTLYDHLINLRRAVGGARILVNDRNYGANFVGFNSDTEDLVTSGPQFTVSGGNPSDIMSRLNEIMSYAGLTPHKSAAIPQMFIPIGQSGAGIHKVQTPWGVKGPITDTSNNNDHYIASQFTASDVAVREQLSIVGIKSLHEAT